jgi:alpha-L-fucosidase
MTLTRRSAMRGMAGAAPAVIGLRAARGAQEGPEIAQGPFLGTRESLKAYRTPEWFRDAKFGIWSHWGPQSAPEYGDWYARNMYIEGHRQYKYHLKTYGHPSRFGFKDVIPTWKAEQFDAEHLVSLYRKAGAKYFVSMGVHHDNFDLWNSKHQQWNAVNMGPKKDIVGLFQKAARKEGLKFGVSEHLAVSYHWFQTSHGADKEGEFKGVPYDGAEPKYVSLYHETHEAPKSAWQPEGVPLAWKRTYFTRIKDLIDQYEPDLLYTDGPIFFEEWGLGVISHLYNQSAKRHGGKVEAVYTNKGRQDCETGTCVLDLERGIVDEIWPSPWQTDTCVGNWHYDKEAKYKTSKTVIDMLVDIVSRNGNLLLNFPVRSNGTIDDQELKIVGDITAWMSVNSEAIYGTRPWKIFGQGPGTQKSGERSSFNERGRKPLTAEDIRFTTKGKTLYAFFMGWPEREAAFPTLALGGPQGTGKIRDVELLGSRAKLEWKQDERALTVAVPPQKPCENAFVLKVTGAV